MAGFGKFSRRVSCRRFVLPGHRFLFSEDHDDIQKEGTCRHRLSTAFMGEAYHVGLKRSNVASNRVFCFFSLQPTRGSILLKSYFLFITIRTSCSQVGIRNFSDWFVRYRGICNEQLFCSPSAARKDVRAVEGEQGRSIYRLWIERIASARRSISDLVL